MAFLITSIHSPLEEFMYFTNILQYSIFINILFSNLRIMLQYCFLKCFFLRETFLRSLSKVIKINHVDAVIICFYYCIKKKKTKRNKQELISFCLILEFELT